MEKDKILIVDDEPDIALILKLQLEDAGYLTERAQDGVEALEAVAREPFSLIMLDLKMPRMDGLEVLSRIQGSDMPPVVIMTAHGSEDIAVDAMKKGALDYISKPFSTDDMLQKVARAISLHKTSKPPKTRKEPFGALSELGPTSVEDISADDHLGRKDYTKALVRLLTVRDDDKPYAIGLFGQWGSGKSSQIAQVKAVLMNQSAPRVKFVEFNAWSHEHANNVAAALAQSVVDALVENLSFVDQVILAAKLSRKRRAKTIAALERDRLRLFRLGIESWSVWSPAVVAIILIGFSIYFFVNYDIRYGISASLLAIPTALLTYFGSSHFVSKNLTDWFKKFNIGKELRRFQLPDYSSHLGLYHEIRKNVEHLCGLLQHQPADPNSGDYLLLVVDDLDRCGPEMVKQVFNAVRLVANIPRVVTLVAIDERIAFSAVKQYYDTMGHAGREPALVARDYLAKVFQVAINLPAPDSVHIRTYVTTKLFGEIKNISSSGNEFSETFITSEEQEKSVSSHPNNTNDNVLPKSSEKGMRGNDVVDGEKELFADLAISYSFSNPRLLWRMMQSWRLLKCLVLTETYDLPAADQWVRLLFWREWLFQQGDLYRQSIDSLPFSRFKERVTNQIRDVLPSDLNDGEYMEKCIRVDAVLLPAAPKGQSEVLGAQVQTFKN